MEELQVPRRQTCVFGDPSQHARANFVTLMEREDVVGEAGFCKDAMRSGLSFNCPTVAQ